MYNGPTLLDNLLYGFNFGGWVENFLWFAGLYVAWCCFRALRNWWGSDAEYVARCIAKANLNPAKVASTPEPAAVTVPSDLAESALLILVPLVVCGILWVLF